ncbi:MAG: xanthine phosphoribosyltransferase [Acidiferrobacterales bacterium]|jgi:xanthine phosphoribosyltransferase|nr:xanthine phosphoribosyltransferase [Acidiferrobacterales bacterium]
MHELDQRILAEAVYLGNGIVKLDSFLNHRIDTILMTGIGKELARLLLEGGASSVNKVVTAETSGIAPALTTAQALGVPMVFARKKRPVTLVGDCYQSSARSHTKGELATLHISGEYLSPDDRVVIIDDFLGTGDTAEAMLDLVEQSGATLCGIGYVIEKVFEHGRDHMREIEAPVVALARIDIENDRVVIR